MGKLIGCAIALFVVYGIPYLMDGKTGKNAKEEMQMNL